MSKNTPLSSWILLQTLDPNKMKPKHDNYSARIVLELKIDGITKRQTGPAVDAGLEHG